MSFCNRTTRIADIFNAMRGATIKAPSPAYPTFELSSEQELPQNIRDENATWIVSRTLTGHDAPSDDDNDQPPVPVWSAYNSLVNEHFEKALLMYVVPLRNSLRKLEMRAKKALRRTSRRRTIALPTRSSLLK